MSDKGDKNNDVRLNEAARKSRRKKALANLERDNHHDDPHPDLNYHDTPNHYKFNIIMIHEDNLEEKKIKYENFNLRGQKNYSVIIEDKILNGHIKDKRNYWNARAPPSKYPPRHLCAVCGFYANYSCIQCGDRFCSKTCLCKHKETRCMK